MNTMGPKRRSAMPGVNAWTSHNADSTLTAWTWRQVAASTSLMVTWSNAAPLPVPWVVLLGQLSNALRDLRCGAARVAGPAVVLSAAWRVPAGGGNGALLPA